MSPTFHEDQPWNRLLSEALNGRMALPATLSQLCSQVEDREAEVCCVVLLWDGIPQEQRLILSSKVADLVTNRMDATALEIGSENLGGLEPLGTDPMEEDLRGETQWPVLRRIAQIQGLTTCTWLPLEGHGQGCSGLIALLRGDARVPGERDPTLLEGAAGRATLLVQIDRRERAFLKGKAHFDALESELKASETRLQAIVRAIPDFYFRAKTDGTILDFHFNEMPTALGKWNPTGQRFQDAPIPKEIKANIAKLASLALQTEKVQMLEYDISIPEGRFFREARVSPSGQDELVIFVRDITERKRAETALRHRLEAERLTASLSKALLQSGADTSDEALNDALATIGRFVGVDRCHLNQLSTDGLMARRTHEWCSEGTRPWIRLLQEMPCVAFPWVMGYLNLMAAVPITQLEEIPENFANEREYFKGQGIQSLLVVPLCIGTHLLGFLGFDAVRVEKHWKAEDLKILQLGAELFSSVLDRKRLFDTLKASEARYQALVEQQGEGLISVDAEERIVLANRAAEALFGVPLGGLMGHLLQEFLDEEQFARVLQQTAIRRAGIKNSYDLTIYQPDGRARQILVSSSPLFDGEGKYLGANGIFHDVTERRCLEERIQRARAHEGLVAIASGIAHDFNNLLAVIRGNTDLTCESLRAGQDPEPFLIGIHKAVTRAAELTRQMLASAGGGQSATELINVNGLKEALEGGLQATFPAPPPIQFNLAEDLPLIEVDPKQLCDVLHSLLANAVEALDGRDGTLTMSTNWRLLAEEEIEAHLPDLDLKPGPYVRMTISDTGCGMDSKLQSRIFDPFFSTKFAGRGLGLSSALGILKSYEAGLQVHSRVGEGSTFTIYFPASESKLEVPQLSRSTQ